MIIAKLLLYIALVFAALSLVCAVTVGRRAPRQSGHFGGRFPGAKWASSAPADPYSEAFGDMPEPCGFGTSQNNCRQSGRALGPDAGSGGRFFPSGHAAARNPSGSWRGRKRP
jgi:hypothetical protein